jgi:hypothetical protein
MSEMIDEMIEDAINDIADYCANNDPDNLDSAVDNLKLVLRKLRGDAGLPHDHQGAYPPA